ncbi:COX15/CtaA family protein [Parasphingopyxis marina]|uniref:Heme A synthase n=1 Tax=Parasphingopyxis marina TaxID=2761622 RepID=A0A842HZU1_9SPHN|nr:COX15/CtaA family protein [Parasphingopyxis marina]MBC2778395.1 COX15/CtaA family protein [Parasphingopyxis marina]
MTSTSIPATPDALRQSRPRAIAVWLMAVAGLVFLMVVVGGITRLTESGLSMVRWEPISGIIPPLNAEQWQAEFAAYQASPEYQQVNRGMSLAQFQTIFFWEYLHRALGRLIGLAFALPLLWFWIRKAIPQAYHWRLVALLALGGMQGAIGWWMVASGLVDRPDVSHIRLAVHLMAALFIFGGLIWTALDLFALDRDPAARPARLTWGGVIVLAIVAGQIKLGAFVAGLDAGFAFNSWPKMGSEWFPSGTPMLSPWWSNFADNPIVVQFAHRWWAVVTVIALIWLARQARKQRRLASVAIHSAFGTQFLLGIATLLTGVNIVVATAHQGVGALVVATMVWGIHLIGRRQGETVTP